MTQPQVLIVGAGPAGLLLALSLLKNNVPVRIIEKDDHFHSMERGSGIMPRTLEIEHLLGVESDIKRIGLPTPSLHFFEPNNPRKPSRSVSMVERFDPTPSFPTTGGVMLGQSRHQSVLREHIERLGGCIELGSSLSEFSQEGDEVVAKIIKKVDGEELEEITKVRYLVGSDGGKSTVRKIMGVDFLGNTDDGAKIYTVDAIVEGLGVDPEDIKSDIFMYGKEGGPMVAIRGTGIQNKLQLLFFNPIFDLVEAQSADAIQSELRRLTNRPELGIKELISHAPWRANLRIASHFRKGNVFIIGDAAHTHSPTGGQGLNSSIQDSFNLGWKLALVLKGFSHPSLLDSYEEERIPVISEMLQITTDLYKRTFYGEETKNGIIHKQDVDLKDTPYFRAKKLFQLHINYRWSSFVCDERDHQGSGRITGTNAYGSEGQQLRAGDRAPDAPGLVQLEPKTVNNSPSRLFDIFKPTLHTVIVYATKKSLLKASLILEPLRCIQDSLLQTLIVIPEKTNDLDPTICPAEVVLTDTGGHAYQGYGIERGSENPVVVIVRPDGMVGAFATSSAGITKYSTRVFA